MNVNLGYPPSLWDRANGADGIYPAGTYVSPEKLSVGGVTGVNYGSDDGNTNRYGYPYMFEEMPDSPVVEFAEQCTITHKFYVDYETGQNAQVILTRGYIMMDGLGNLTRVLSTNLQPGAVNPKSNIICCALTVISEAQSFATPPDEFDVEIVELNPSIFKHPRYVALNYQDRYNIRNYNIADNQDVAQLYKTQLDALQMNPNQYLDEKGQALEIMLKLQKGEESFYLSGYKIIWTSYYWGTQFINPGGYIENPFTAGGLPYDFWSPSGDGTDNIFQNVQGFNPNMFPAELLPPASYGLSWLRQTDQLHLQRTWYRLTRSWVGAPLSHWDPQLYSSYILPLQTEPDEGAQNQ